MIKDIFLVSDDHDTINFIRDYYAALGLNCWTLTPQTLFSSLRLNKPGLLMVDFVLKDAFGGSLCHQLKCDPYLQDIPVALLTEYNTVDRFAPKFGCSHLLTKPLNRNALNTLFQSVQKTELQNK